MFRLVILAPGSQQHAQLVVGFGIRRLKPYCFLKMCHGLIRGTFKFENMAKIIVSFGKRSI